MRREYTRLPYRASREDLSLAPGWQIEHRKEDSPSVFGLSCIQAADKYTRTACIRSSHECATQFGCQCEVFVCEQSLWPLVSEVGQRLERCEINGQTVASVQRGLDVVGSVFGAVFRRHDLDDARSLVHRDSYSAVVSDLIEFRGF